VTNYTVQSTINGNNGALLFWGFIDSGNEYKKISFGNTASGVDVFGFDDMVVGDLQQVTPPIPEPTTRVLVLAGLLGLVAVRRLGRKQ
jgi:hypothetical protein